MALNNYSEDSREGPLVDSGKVGPIVAILHRTHCVAGRHHVVHERVIGTNEGLRIWQVGWWWDVLGPKNVVARMSAAKTGSVLLGILDLDLRLLRSPHHLGSVRQACPGDVD